jgi:dipeptidyl aminopeptidase/acylaminoacyl peptidase
MHGGPIRQMMLGFPDMDYYHYAYAENEYLVSLGFEVLSVNYRTGIMYGRAFREPPNAGWRGAAEYQDIVAAAKFLQSQPGVDPAKIGLWGGSYGGYLTALGLARNSDIFKAGVDMHGVHDWSSLMTAVRREVEERDRIVVRALEVDLAGIDRAAAAVQTQRAYAGAHGTIVVRGAVDGGNE